MELEGAFFGTSQFDLTSNMLGEGSFGKVYIVIYKKDKTQYAAKIIDAKSLKSGKDQMMLIRESEILHKLHHPAIVKFIGINLHSFKDPSKLEPTILTEYLTNGSLKEILDKEKQSIANGDWTPTKKYICLLGISDAMRYLHEQQIIHRDLKPQNILIDSNFYPRVCDFGLSRCLSEAFSRSMQLSMTGQIGTPLYMAPELYDDDDDDGDGDSGDYIQKYGPSIDVYAFAILAYEIVTGLEPFSKSRKPITMMQLTKKLSNGQRPEFNRGVTSKMKELISKCWSTNPKDRPTFKEFFEKLSSDFSYFDEDVDEDEINEYLEDLKESREKEEEAKPKPNRIKVVEEEKEANSKAIEENKNYISKFVIEEEIAHGISGTIYKANFYEQKDKSITSYAIKYIELGEFDQNLYIKNLVGIQESLEHTAILPLITFCKLVKFNDKYKIITPFMPNGTLLDLIKKVKEGKAPPNYETIKAKVIFGVAAAMAYIHNEDIIFRDLKLENILFDENYDPKICGFGSAVRKNGNFNNGDVGMPLYMAPEVFDDNNYSSAADVYSYSIVLYYIFTLHEPYLNVKYQQLINLVTNGVKPEINETEVPSIFLELITCCWNSNPIERPSFKDIVKVLLDRKEVFFDFSKINKKEFDNYIQKAIGPIRWII